MANWGGPQEYVFLSTNTSNISHHTVLEVSLAGMDILVLRSLYGLFIVLKILLQTGIGLGIV